MTHEEIMRDYLKDIEERRLPDLRAWLAPLEKGEMTMGERKTGDSLFTDTTQREIDRAKKTIAEYETIAERLRNTQSP